MVTARDYALVRPDLAVWHAYDPAVKTELYSAALITPDSLIFIDPIGLPDESVSALAGRGRPAAVILTNGNHARAASKYAARFECPILSSRKAGLALNSPFHRLLDDAPLPDGVQLIPIPSAGPGEVAVLKRDILCLGDALINVPKYGFTFLPERYCCDPANLRSDLRKLLSYHFDIMTFAHGDPILEHGRDRLHELLA